MLLRSFAIQGSWNYETLIGAGFAYTILPALRTIYPEQDGHLQAAVTRHLELFNSHPYLATVAVGAITRLESEGVEPVVVHRFKAALRGSLGSIGDRLIWSAWRPMSVLLALVLLLMGAAWWVAISAFLIVYNAMHLTIRTIGLRLGTDAGLEVGRELRGIPFQLAIDWSSKLACVFVGAALTLAAAPFAGDPAALAATLVAVVAGFVLGVRTRLAMVALVAVVTIFALLLGLIGYGA